MRLADFERRNGDLTKESKESERTCSELAEQRDGALVRAEEFQRQKAQVEQQLAEYENTRAESHKITRAQQDERTELKERLAKAEARAVESQLMCQALKDASGQRVSAYVELETERDELKKRLAKAETRATKSEQKCEVLKSEIAPLHAQVADL
jgi:chromosome segregation ATPase